MNVTDYISSGILESYVMGLTSNWENLQVEAMIAKHPEIKKEVAIIEEKLFSLAQATQVTPSSKLKAKVFAAIEGKPVTVKKEKIIELHKNKPTGNSILKWAVAASVALLVGSATFNFYLLDKLDKANAHLAHLTSEMNELGEKFTVVQTNYNTANEQLKIYEGPENKMICLVAVSDTTSLAHVYWNTNNKTVFVEVNHLPLAPDTMQYQLWAIENGVPQSAGLLTTEQAAGKTILQMNNVVNAQAFAITLEQKGGTALPEGQMYVMGKI